SVEVHKLGPPLQQIQPPASRSRPSGVADRLPVGDVGAGCFPFLAADGLVHGSYWAPGCI
ncbi:hypothetical protein ACWGJW_33810, partial [Streptomyces nigrescens]